jgi:glycosyltransferase involved in cell wall biosynthesis
MRIGIDTRFLTHPQAGGFKAYTTHLVKALARVDADNEYVLYLDRSGSAGALPQTGPNFRVRVVTGTHRGIGPVWREQVLLARTASQDRLDVFHSPALSAPLFVPCPLLLTIHDMIWYHRPTTAEARPSLRRNLMWWYYRVISERAILRAHALLTVSRSAQSSILQVFASMRERTFVTYEAAGTEFVPVHDAARVSDVRRRHALPVEYILALGSADPRKNIRTLLDAYGKLPVALRARYPLVIVWTHSLLMEDAKAQVSRLGLSNGVRFVHRVSDGDLAVLYNQAKLFVFPSRQEGFGLPLLEAMASGTPVVAADNSSIPEVAGSAALLVDACDPDALSAAMARVLSDPALRADLAHRGVLRARSFSWERCARETVAAYRLVHTSARNRPCSRRP